MWVLWPVTIHDNLCIFRTYLNAEHAACWVRCAVVQNVLEHAIKDMTASKFTLIEKFVDLHLMMQILGLYNIKVGHVINVYLIQ